MFLAPQSLSPTALCSHSQHLLNAPREEMFTASQSTVSLLFLQAGSWPQSLWTCPFIHPSRGLGGPGLLDLSLGCPWPWKPQRAGTWVGPETLSSKSPGLSGPIPP